MANVSEVLIKRLTDAGVRHIFGVPGDSINALLEAIRLQDTIKFIHVNHEETGAFAASAMAKLTGKLAVCVGTSGPGAIHLLNGLYDAKCDHAPVLAITGQVETKRIGSDYQQEIDLISLFEPVAAYNQMIVNPEQLPFAITRAIHTSLRARTVSHINVPLDLASEAVPHPDSWPLQLGELSWPQEDKSALNEVASLINKSSKVAILAGIGCREAAEKVFELAERLQAPIAHSLRAKALFPEQHPLSTGGIGNLGVLPSVEAVKNCELLLLLGTDFPYDDYLPDDAKIIQIDIDPCQIGKRKPVAAGLVGSVGSIVDALLPLLERKVEHGFLTKIQKQKEKWQRQSKKDVAITSMTIKPQRLANLIGEVADASTVFVCDTGEVTAWTARYMPMKDGQMFTVSGMLASMAFGLPGAIGAKLAYPERPVVALVGDGGFSMLMTDLLTAVRYKLRIVFVIFNNSRLGMIQIEQEVKGYPNYETDMFNPDFSAFAKVCGAQGRRVTEPLDLEPAIAEAFRSAGPFVLDVMIDRDAIPLPPVIKASQAAHFGMAKVKEFVSGDGRDD